MNWRMPGSPKHNTSVMHCKHFAGKQNTGGGVQFHFLTAGVTSNELQDDMMEKSL